MHTRISIAAVVATAMLGTAAPAGASTYPVTYSIPQAIAATVANPEGSPPGANDWSCKPSAAHPEPVVLVHGLLANMSDNWNTMSPLLANNGFCVFALTYGTDSGDPYFGGLEPMERSATQLAAFVERVLSATGASKVDLVGHSEGTVMPRYYMAFLGGASKVDRYVMFTPIWHGTNVGGLATVEQLGTALSPSSTTLLNELFASATGCGSCSEFLTGSPFLKNLDEHGWALPGTTYTDIVTRYDELVVPYTSGILDEPNVTNFTLQDQCPLDYSEHLTVAFDPTAAQDMLNALDPEHAKPVPCTLVLPGVGAPLAPTTVGLSSGSSSPTASVAEPSTTSESPRQGTSAAYVGTSSCTAISNLTFRLHRVAGQRITRVEVLLSGHRLLTRRGRNLRRIRIAGLPGGSYVLVIRTTTSRGVHRRSTRKISGCLKRHSTTRR